MRSKILEMSYNMTISMKLQECLYGLLVRILCYLPSPIHILVVPNKDSYCYKHNERMHFDNLRKWGRGDFSFNVYEH